MVELIIIYEYVGACNGWVGNVQSAQQVAILTSIFRQIGALSRLHRSCCLLFGHQLVHLSLQEAVLTDRPISQIEKSIPAAMIQP
jgi:hypothetical protein